MTGFTYLGSELDVFEEAANWKAYWGGQIQPFVKGDVLEVGAGIGANTRGLIHNKQGRWVCLEPDGSLCERMRITLPASFGVTVVQGTVLELAEGDLYDTILYIDVLEHIERDRDELARASSHLRPGGTVIVLSPAYHWLYTPFDRAIGHYRRYHRSSLTAAAVPELSLVMMRYLDIVGVLASLGNKLLLRQSLPTPNQIRFWDRYIVPVSRCMDRITGFRAGKSLLAIWRRMPHDGDGSRSPVTM